MEGVIQSQQGPLYRPCHYPLPCWGKAAKRAKCNSSECYCTCRIRSPSRMRPSLAAMLFGLICEDRQDTVRSRGKKTTLQTVLTCHSDHMQVRRLDERSPLFLPVVSYFSCSTASLLSQEVVYPSLPAVAFSEVCIIYSP